jgi:TetR/AcrR family transcriptional regulator
MERIAASAGVNKQLLFYYYHSKRGLFQIVLKRGESELETALAAIPMSSGSPLERLRDVLLALFEFLERHPQLVALLSHAERVDASPFTSPVRRLVVLLAEGQGLGLVRDDLDPHIAAAQALVLMLGYLRLEPLIAASAPPLGADEPALRERWRHAAVDLVVHGVRAPAV